MAERGRQHQRSDVYAEHRSRDRDYSHNGEDTSYDSKGRNQGPRDIDERVSAGGRRAKQYRQRDMTAVSYKEPPAYRDHDHEGPSRL